MAINNTFTDYKNIILSKLIENENLLKALTINQTNFLDYPLSIDPTSTVYNYIYPYKGQKTIVTTEKSILTMRFANFRPVGNKFKEGDIYFYIICHNNLVRSDYGNRYDFISDTLKEIFNNSRDFGIGKAELKDVSDIDIDDTYMGSACIFHISDFV